MNEQKLIEQARQGDKDAFCAVYGLYKDKLYRYAFYRLRNAQDVEDAVSECVLSAWKQIPGLRDASAFPGWIFRILNGCCGKMIKLQIDRKDQVQIETSYTEPKTSGEDTDRSLILQEALDQLTDEERNIVLLSVVSGLKSREIAELTGMTAGSVRSSLSRSLKKMRGYLS